MSELSVGFDEEAIAHLEKIRERLIGENVNYVARCGVGLILYCVPRVQDEGKTMCTVDRTTGEVANIIEIASGAGSVDDEFFSGEVSGNTGLELIVTFAETPSAQIKDIATRLFISEYDVVKEGCRLYAYIVPRLLDGNMDFGLLNNDGFKSLKIPGLALKEGTAIH